MDDYAYINARLRAMLGRLLERADYETFLACNTLVDLLKDLLGSPYAWALERAAESPNGATGEDIGTRIDEALRQDLVRSLANLRGFASDRPLELIEALLLRWDAYNVKTLLRGKRAAAPTEEILASTFPVGRLDEVALAELARAPTLREVADTLQTWRMPIARPLRKGLQLMGEADTFEPLEFELDCWTYSEALRVVANGNSNNRVVRDYLRLLVDKVNLVTALRYLEVRSPLSGAPIAPGHPLPPGLQGVVAMGRDAARFFLEAAGRFTEAQFDAIVSARDVRHGLSLLAETPYRWLAEGLAEEEPVSLTRLERQLDRMLLRTAVALSREDPLGIGVAVSYLEQKTNEVRNLRMILQGKAAGMAPEQITEWLII